MKKNEELKYKTKNTKLSKKNYLVIIIPIILSLILIISIAVYVFIYSNPTNKIKRYLIKNNYICNNISCQKEDNSVNYIFYYKTATLYIDTITYNLTISKNTPILEIKSNEYKCTYTTNNYTPFTLIDSSFVYNRECEEYISEINNYIKAYEEIFDNANVDVNQI